jgi:aminopeptidase N
MGRTVNGDTATTHWRMRNPMATYLAFFAAGDFVIEKGRAHGLRYYNAVSKALPAYERRASVRVLRHSAAVTAWLQHDLGDYPFATTGGLVTTLPAGFAMENQSRPTYSGYADLITVVHELAHQWFGDSVAVARWRDIWLNEGFATWAEWFWDAQGRDDHLRDIFRLYYEAGAKFRKRFGLRRLWGPVVSPPPKDLFGAAVYDRGGMTLEALRELVGNATFLSILRDWVAQHKYGNATTEQFIALAEQESGRSLSHFFDVWLRQPGRPVGWS